MIFIMLITLFIIGILLMKKLNLAQVSFFITSLIFIYLTKADIFESLKHLFILIILIFNFSLILFNSYWSYKSE